MAAVFMWVLTTSGFLSAVEHRDDSDLLVVRARAREDLRTLCEWAGTTLVDSPNADYPHRTIVRKQRFADWVRAQAAAIDYPNFKDAVGSSQGYERASVYSQVWAALRQLTRIGGAG